jgi:asparagine synthase (glutamine-hydrolysing)
MCGIAGYLSFHTAPEENTLRKMAAAIHYRGPDAEGFFTEKICGLAHRRLSIIDLSNAANQPMFSAGQRYVIVYNGEVYNFREIGEQLKQDNKDFIPQTTSDTEIILEAFAHYGKDFVSMLNGMFAIAIYDRQQECLWLFRDRIGVKPLFVFQGAGIFAFASEMKALMQHPVVRQETRLNP